MKIPSDLKLRQFKEVLIHIHQSRAKIDEQEANCSADKKKSLKAAGVLHHNYLSDGRRDFQNPVFISVTFLNQQSDVQTQFMCAIAIAISISISHSCLRGQLLTSPTSVAVWNDLSLQIESNTS